MGKCITAVTPTICKLMGIAPPSASTHNTLSGIIRAIGVKYGITRIDKCLFYAPDAIGQRLFRKYRLSFEPILKYAPLKINLRSVYPSYTPVCFASMFTGALPVAHGIRKYEKPVLACDTIFDAFVRAGKRVAIAAVAGSSINRIFRNRQIDYFSDKYDQQVTDRVIKLLQSDKHDFILAYHQEYDDALHRTTPESPASIRAMNRHIRSFGRLAQAVGKYWGRYNSLVVFGPDHGAHINPKTGKGIHGADIAEDMEIIHFFGVSKKPLIIR